MASQDNQKAAFERFPDLYEEIRRMIWKQCLPKRVLEVDFPDDMIEEYTHCDLQNTSEINARPPFITRVCRESRRVAFENAGFMHHPIFENFWGWEPRAHQWFCPKTDIVHMHWFPGYNIGYGWEGTPVPEFFLQATKSCAAPSFSTDLLQFFDHSFWDSIDEAILGHLEESKEYLITIRVICLHLPLEQALRSELFGRLAEERVKLVDASDEGTIWRFYEAWKSGPEQDIEPAAMLQEMTSINHFQAKLHRWKNLVKARWLYSKWKLVKKKNFIGIDNPDGIWTNPDEPFFTTPNIEHPWTAQVLRSVPKFKPMVMFRLCDLKCYLQPHRKTRVEELLSPDRKVLEPNPAVEQLMSSLDLFYASL